ncbi:MAG: hypothetical protein HON90_17430 [Halobacteriovoraceae bacterium]|jgi:hypothetical protein|nr:hypothetical protein [Halobacteriovoraceae bacterium]
MNERGSTTLFGISLLILISLIGLHILSKRINEHKDLHSKQSLLLCTKKINGETQQYIKKIQRYNKALKLLTLGKAISLFIPGANVATSSGMRQAIKVLKLIQLKLAFSYVKNITIEFNKHCYFSPNLLITPFQYKLVGFSRNKFNEALPRGNKWKIKTLKGKYIIITIINLKSGKIISKIHEVNLLSKLPFLSL